MFDNERLRQLGMCCPCDLRGRRGPRGCDGEDGERGPRGFRGDQGLRGFKGEDGESAYDIAVDEGYEGTIEEWLKSLKGKDGKDGEDGKSAYEIAKEHGFDGTEDEWLDSLKGETGSKGDKGDKGNNGEDGKSAYEIAIEEGFEGSIEDWLKSLKGDKGDKGDTGTQGLKGDKGDTGAQGPKGDKGDKGDQGTAGMSPTLYHSNLYATTRVHEFWLTDYATIRLEYANSTTFSMKIHVPNGTALVDYKRSSQDGTSSIRATSKDNITVGSTYEVIDPGILFNSTEMHKVWIRIRDNNTNLWSLFELNTFASNGGRRIDTFIYTIYKDLDVNWVPV